MKKINTIFTHGGSELGIDDNNKLYWNKKLILTEKKITFNKWVNISIIIASVSTLMLAIFTIWFGLRQINIKNSCYFENQENKKIISELNISDERYEELVDRTYKECLRKNGL
jgi:hypothetical protein